MSINSLIGYDDTLIRQRVLELAQQELGLNFIRPEGVLNGIIETIIEALLWQYRQVLRPLNDNTNLLTASGEWLDNWGQLVGVIRYQGSKASGRVVLTASSSGTVTAGAKISFKGSSVVFIVKDELSFKAGNNSLVVEADNIGADYNLNPSYTPYFERVVSGVTSLALANGWLKVAGEGVENDESYRARIQARILSFADGDAPLLYKIKAEELDDVNEARVFRTQGQQAARIVLRGNDGLMPSQGVLEQAQELLGKYQLVGRQLLVLAVGVKTLNLKIKYNDTTKTEQEIQARAEHYFRALKIGQPYTLQDIYNLYDDIAYINISKPKQDDHSLAADTVYDVNIKVEQQ